MRMPVLFSTMMLAIPGVLLADEPVFSGPQAGEALPELKVRDVQWKGKRPEDGIQFSEEPVSWTADAADRPMLLVFVHELTRPGMALSRAVTRYASTLDNAFCGIVFLTDDRTKTEQWIQRARGTLIQLRQKSRIGISVDGIEGPGAYGLNRNVQVTVLVAKGGKTTANFALVQPSAQADSLKIATAIAKAAGAKPPTAESLAKVATMMNAKRGAAKRGGDAKGDAKGADRVDLREVLGPLLRKDLSPEQVAVEAKKVEAVAKDNADVRDAIGRAASRIVAAKKLENYGSPAAQVHLKTWARKWAPKKEQEPRRQPERQPERRPER